MNESETHESEASKFGYGGMSLYHVKNDVVNMLAIISPIAEHTP